MNSVAAVALADLRQRTRTFATLVVVAAALQAGFLFVPDASAPYVVVNLGGWRGVYNSAWMGATTALMSVTLMPLFGFFLVRPAMTRDAALNTWELLASAPLGRRLIVVGKWLSNTAFLSGIAAVLVVAAMVMQVVRGESRGFDLSAYLLPFLFASVPACAVTAACAVVFSAIPGMRGVLGGVAWFFGWQGLFLIPLAPTLGSGHHQHLMVAEALYDPLGITTLLAEMIRSVQAHVGAAHMSNDIEIGGDASAGIHTFNFDGITWHASSLARRALVVGASALACAAVAPLAFRGAAPAKRSKGSRAGSFAAKLPLPSLLRVELAQGFGIAGMWWLLGAVAVTLAALFVPHEGIVRVVAPLAWVWPVGPIGALSVIDVRSGLDGVLLATPTPAWRRAGARWLAAFLLACGPIVALSLREGGAGFALLAIAAAVAACGIAFGTVARSALLFEGCALLVWYLGPVNRVSGFDPAQAVHAPLVATACAAVVAACALSVAAFRVSRRA